MADRRPQNISLVAQAEAFGLEAHSCDGNDVFSVSNLAARAVDQIRLGGGPQFMEAFTYRWLEHCGPNEDEHLGYRSGKEIEEWKKRDPIVAVECKIQDTTKDAINRAISREIEDAFIFAEQSEFGPVSELFEDIFPKGTSSL